MTTIIEFSIYQKLTGNHGTLYYCENSDDKTGKFVSLDEYEAKYTEGLTVIKAADDVILSLGQEVERLQGDKIALEQVIANYREIETGLIELNNKGNALIAQAANEVTELKQANTELKDIIKSLLFIFDRDLPPNSIGCKRCDEAIELLGK